jgi:hypothetical protein
MSGVTGDLISATSIATFMVGAYGMDNSLYSYLAFGQEAMAKADVKKQVEIILANEFRKVRRMLEQNRDAVIAIAEALLLRNELTDLDVNDILHRVEATHPFVNTVDDEPKVLQDALPVEVISDSSLPVSGPIHTSPLGDAGSVAYQRDPIE